jgi:hypothetical protein
MKTHNSIIQGRIPKKVRSNKKKIKVQAAILQLTQTPRQRIKNQNIGMIHYIKFKTPV